MKTEVLPVPFTPKTVKITFETQKELDMFYALCDTSALINSMRAMGGEMPAWKELANLGAENSVSNAERLVNKIAENLAMIGVVKVTRKL